MGLHQLSPAAESTTLELSNPVSNASLAIYNSYGQMMKKMNNLNGKLILIQRDNLANGIYFIQLLQDNKVIADDKIILID